MIFHLNMAVLVFFEAGWVQDRVLDWILGRDPSKGSGEKAVGISADPGSGER